MHVLVVIAWDGGGVPVVMDILNKHLAKRGVRYSAFSFNGWVKNSKWAAFCEQMYSNRDISLTEVLVKHDFDVVKMIDTACPPPYNTNLWLERARYSGGVICNSHNNIQELHSNQFAHVFVACSHASKQVMARTISSDVRVIPNGVEVGQFRPISVDRPSRPIFGWVGRAGDYSQKDISGFLYLASALGTVEFDFWIADAGNSLETLRLKDWFGDRIRYVSQLGRDELTVFYNQIAISGGALISTSTFEGLPMALLEAAACRCPIIAPRAPGMEYLADGVTALLYDRLDGLQGIITAISRLKDPVLRDSIINASEKTVHDYYNSTRMADEYFLAYQDAIAASADTSPGRSNPPFSPRVWSFALGVRRELRKRRLV